MMKRKRHTACGKKKMPVASCIILLVIVLGCVFADVICKKDPSYLDLMNYTKAPSAEFWFGTDTLGRDIFSCIWHGGRVSLLIGVASTALSTVIAIVYGGNECPLRNRGGVDAEFPGHWIAAGCDFLG